MPTENIPNLKSLGKQHLSLLKQMKDKGISIAKDRLFLKFPQIVFLAMFNVRL